MTRQSAPFQLGVEVLLQRPAWLEGRRAALVGHPASVNSKGVHSAHLLKEAGANLVCLMGPEHGFWGRGGAGEQVDHQTHSEWGLPIYSLYGAARKPSPEMLEGVDVILFDLQDLGSRNYTYVSTLRYVLEAAAETGKTVVVADRPIPFPNGVDGPMREDAFESFVGFIRAPVAYGMTPGEAALWIRKDLGLQVEILVAGMENYSRAMTWPLEGGWTPPSPSIRSLACAQCFPATVFFEALPAVDHARKTEEAFQLVGAPWLDGAGLARSLNALSLPGVRFQARRYMAASGEYAGQQLEGVKIDVADPPSFQPVLTGVALIREIQAFRGAACLWSHPGTREDFFDKLMGSDQPRRALQNGDSLEEIEKNWRTRRIDFMRSREAVLLYR